MIEATYLRQDASNDYKKRVYQYEPRNIREYRGFQIAKWARQEHHILKDGFILAMLSSDGYAKEAVDVFHDVANTRNPFHLPAELMKERIKVVEAYKGGAR